MNKLLNFFIFLSISIISCTPMNEIVYLNESAPYLIPPTNNDINHKLNTGDILHIKILGSQQEVFEIFNIENSANNQQTTSANLFMNGFTIDSDGLIDIPTIGKIALKGLTIEEAKDKIQTKADNFLINSTVIVKHINFEITILGEVYKPGNYTVYKNNITIFEAIGLAGDLTDYGNRKSIKIIRKDSIINVDLTNQSILTSQNNFLKSGDILYIEPLNTIKTRNSKAPIYLSGISGLALIANIVLRSIGIY
ncbi:MAG: polysaccharide transporter [Flavobacteriales bacterium]|nr:polysaccharide transporter [Flavobacteriales bacterium]